MFLSWEVFRGGYDFGTGVHISNLYIRGYSPLFMLVLKISDNSSARYATNCLMSLAGKSPGTVALFVIMITLLNTNQTCAGWNWGISLLVNGGTEISSVFRGSYRFWMDANFSAICSACC